MKLLLEEKRLDDLGGWKRSVLIDRQTDGVENLRVSVISRRGKSVRIPYKPKGENRGYHWWGDVYDRDSARCLWSGRVAKSLGVRGILRRAELIE